METVHKDSGNLYAKLPSFVQVLLSPGGRMNRAEYAAAFFGSVAVFLILPIVVDSLIFRSLHIPPHSTLSNALLIAFVIGFVIGKWIAIVALVKRLHDMDYSGVLWLVMLVPVVGFAIYLLAFLGDGTSGENRYGSPSRFFEPRVLAKKSTMQPA